MIFSALLYEGGLSIALLVAYFYVEPKFNIPTKKFLSMYNGLRMLICLPFAEFIYGFLLQDQACLNKPLCYGIPDIFQHNLTYDIFYLRVNDTVNGAHWIDYMFIPIIFFLTFYFTKDAFFSTLNAGFMVFVHETIWFGFYWLAYFQYFVSEGWYNDLAFFILVSTMGFIALKKYGYYYKNSVMAFGTLLYTSFIATWYFAWQMKVTVINNTQLGNANNFLATQWYGNFTTNAFEVYSWVIIFAIFVLVIIENETQN